MHISSLVRMGGLAALCGAAAIGAQDVGQVVHMDGPGVVAQPAKRTAQPVSNGLTRSQSKALAQGRMPRPGVYRLRSLLSGRCAVVSDSGANPPVETWDCENRDGWQHGSYNNHWVVLPHPAGGITLRGHTQRLRFANQRPAQAREYGNCLGTARGVLIGAARIELQPCEAQNGDWVQTGAPHQRFFPLAAGSSTWFLATAEIGDGADCVSLRENGRDDGTGVIRWQCNRTADQVWRLEWMEPIRDGWENDLLTEGGWYRTPSGHFNILGADGLDIQGTVYNSFETANDGGDYCRKRCAELDQCKAWTWTGPGYVANSNDPPRCYWKNTVGDPINRGPQTFGKLRSGIVRS